MATFKKSKFKKQKKFDKPADGAHGLPVNRDVEVTAPAHPPSPTRRPVNGSSVVGGTRINGSPKRACSSKDFPFTTR